MTELEKLLARVTILQKDGLLDVKPYIRKASSSENLAADLNKLLDGKTLDYESGDDFGESIKPISIEEFHRLAREEIARNSKPIRP
ncbi:MAG: hypothetical protein ABMA00_00065 [Gemmatimonas sp.]